MNTTDPDLAAYCQGLGCDPAAAAIAFLRGGSGLPRHPQFPPDRSAALHQARVGVAAACAHFKIGPGDEVLVPAYNCGSEVDPILKSGATVRLYPISSPGLQIDRDEIRKLHNERTRAIYVIHYFGWPQDLTALAAYCRQHNLILIEDCALAMFSRTPAGHWVGHAGDAAVFSLPKTLPTPDGGILLFNHPGATLPPLRRRPAAKRIARKLLPLFKRRVLRFLRESLLPPKPATSFTHAAREKSEDQHRGLPEMPANYYFDPATATWGMSRVTRGLLRSVDPDSIVNRRRSNYATLLERLRDLPGVTPLLPDLPPGVCPLGLPILVDHREHWLTALASLDIDAYPWWAGYHQALDWDNQPDARRLKDHVLLLPVHQDLADPHMRNIARQVASIAASLTPTAGPEVAR